jgi:hypothetical protein
MRVPVGNYYVYAMTNLVKGREDYKAYYSEFVICGLNVNCESHEPIIVTVTAGETTSKIDPSDWYDPLSRLRGKH